MIGKANTAMSEYSHEQNYRYHYPRCANAATVAIFNGDGQILIGKRWERTRAFPGYWCLAGGMIEAKCDNHPGERIEETALREVKEETNIDLMEHQLRLFDVNSHPDLDPRAHTLNVCYWAVVDFEQEMAAQAGDDLVELRWISADEVPDYEFAFNHGCEIIPKALIAYRNEFSW